MAQVARAWCLQCQDCGFDSYGGPVREENVSTHNCTWLWIRASLCHCGGHHKHAYQLWECLYFHQCVQLELLQKNAAHLYGVGVQSHASKSALLAWSEVALLVVHGKTQCASGDADEPVVEVVIIIIIII